MPGILQYFLLFFLLIATVQAKKTSKIRINQIGYEQHGPKSAVYQGTADELREVTTFTIVNESGNEVYTGSITDTTRTIEGWHGMVMQGNGDHFTTLDFSEFQEPGTYSIICNDEHSFSFVIDTNLLFKSTFTDQLACYKKMRYYGEEDRKLIVQGTTDTVDIFGGYKEASGDASKHLSHLQFSNYLGGQENPMLTWVLLRTYEQNKQTVAELALETQLFEEVAFGADYLMRSQHEEGWFYTTIFNFWDETKERTVCAYQAGLAIPDSFTYIDIIEVTDDYRSSFRAGGGIAIAALAKTATQGISSDEYSSEQYLQAAIKGYNYIKNNNDSLCYNGKPNIIDDYCALMASIELYKATAIESYKIDADEWADKLIGKQQPEGWFASDDSTLRPYYHGAEEGLPLIALIYYLEIAPEKTGAIQEVVRKNIAWYLQISADNNPFNAVKLYASPYVNDTLLEPRVSYFMPKRNETGYWYQGENARLASLTTALLCAAQLLQSDFTVGSDSISTLAMDQLNWILGKNPFEICMLYGFGQINNPDYVPDRSGRAGRSSIRGGICNGIATSTRPTDWKEKEYIEWAPYEGKSWMDWRWIEQWLPHEFWFTYATSTLSHIVQSGDTPIDKKRAVSEATPLSVQLSRKGNKCYTLHFNKPLAQKQRLRIVTPKGTQLFTTTLSEGQQHYHLPLQELAPGMHLLLIETTHGALVTQKILLQ